MIVGTDDNVGTGRLSLLSNFFYNRLKYPDRFNYNFAQISPIFQRQQSAKFHIEVPASFQQAICHPIYEFLIFQSEMEKIKIKKPHW